MVANNLRRGKSIPAPIWRALLHRPIGSIAYSRDGSALTSRDCSIIDRALVSYCILLQDLCALASVDDPAVLVNDLFRQRDKPGFFDSLCDAIVYWADASIRDVKRVPLKAAPRGPVVGRYRQIVNLFRRPYLDLVKMDGALPVSSRFRLHADAYRYYRQCVMFLAKLPIDACWLHEDAAKTFKRRMDNTPRRLNRKQSDYVSSLKDIIGNWFQDFTIGEFHPRHGTGSVSERTCASNVEKHWQLEFSPRLLSALYGSGLSPKSYALLGLKFGCQPARVTFVPKNLKSLRTICMEPCTNQYFQQGVRLSLERYIQDHRFLSTVFDTRSQDRNQMLALKGSSQSGPHCESFCTIDLSAASDSVTWPLVDAAFSQNTELHSWLCGTRSEWYVLDGTYHELPIFAPMGSALCFPVQSIVFAGICELALRIVVSNSELSWKEFEELHNTKYVVYGDDIIIPAYLVSVVYSLLRTLGFTVNQDKSFVTGPFRESCGIEAYLGYDVTPMKYRVKHGRETFPNSQEHSSYMNAANAAFHEGYRELHRHLSNAIASVSLGSNNAESRKKYLPVFSYDGKSGSICSFYPSNNHLLSRFDKRYHYLMCCHTVVSERRGGKLEGIAYDSYRYLCYLLDPPPLEMDPSYEYSWRHFRLKTVWSPVQLYSC